MTKQEKCDKLYMGFANSDALYKLKLNKFVGRRVGHSDKFAIERIELAFIAAEGQPAVWLASTEWQRKHKSK